MCTRAICRMRPACGRPVAAKQYDWTTQLTHVPFLVLRTRTSTFFATQRPSVSTPRAWSSLTALPLKMYRKIDDEATHTPTSMNIQGNNTTAEGPWSQETSSTSVHVWQSVQSVLPYSVMHILSQFPFRVRGSPHSSVSIHESSYVMFPARFPLDLQICQPTFEGLLSSEDQVMLDAGVTPMSTGQL